MINSIQGNYGVERAGIMPQNSQAKANGVAVLKNLVDVFRSKKVMSEDMKKDYKSLLRPYDTYHGELNQSYAEINVEPGRLFSASHGKGIIGETPFEVTYKQNHYAGKYGKNEFDLQLRRVDLLGGTRIISGTINGQEVEFNLKGDEVPKDKETQDILTAVLLLNGESVRTSNGYLCGTTVSHYVDEEAMATDIAMGNF